MAWFKVDDKLWGHPKWLAVPARARGLWVTAGSWCAANTTDGKIPRHVLTVLGGTVRDAAALVDVGLWREVKAGWIFHEWSTYQPDAASIRAKKQAGVVAGELGNHRRWHSARGVYVPDCEYCVVGEEVEPSTPEDDEKASGSRRVTRDVRETGGNRPEPDSPRDPIPPVPIPIPNSDTQVGGGGYVSDARASEPPPPPTPDILDNLSEPWRCPDHQGHDSPCNQCKRYKAAWKALEAERAKAAKAAEREAARAARARQQAEDAADRDADPEAVRRAAEEAKAAVRAARSTPGSEHIKDKGLTARMEDA